MPRPPSLITLLFFLSLAAVVTNACGKKGSLYLPKPPEQTTGTPQQ
jgi:predicted small lipoprotein YifL